MKKINIFSKDCVSGDVKNFKYMCSGLSCCVYGVVNVSSWLFLWVLICGLVPVLSLSLAVNF